jgi:hypothetical protein
MWHLVAFIKALDLLHKAMLVVLHRRTAMAIEMTSDRGTFFAVAASFVWSKHSKKTMLWSI